MDLIFRPVPGPHIADYVVISLFLAICMTIGIYYSYRTNKQNTLESYFFGNRKLFLVPVSVSLFVTYASAITLMGVPTETYSYGIRGIYLGVAYFFSVVIASFTIVPLLYPLRLTTTYEYLQLRFKSKGVRTIGTLIGMLQTVFYMGITLYAPAVALQTVAGIPLWLSIVGTGLVGTVYTAIGGIKSVVWTDVFQFVMIFIGLIAITIKGNLIMENYPIIEIARQGKRLEFFNFDPDPRVRNSIWGLCFGMIFSSLPKWCSQSCMQRFASLRSLRAAKVSLLMLGPMMLVYITFLGFLGILLYSYYNVLQCDPVQGNFLARPNQLMPFFVLDIFRTLPGITGVYVSCLFSGALSTFSSGINSLAVNTLEDIFGVYMKQSKGISHIVSAKAMVFFYGLVVIGLAYTINYMSGNVLQVALSVFGACGGPLAGLFYFGGLVSKANWIGAIVGSISGLTLNMWIAIGSQIHGKKSIKLMGNPTDGCYTSNITFPENIIGYSTATMNTSDAIFLETTAKTAAQLKTDSGFFLYDISYTWYGFTGFFVTLIIGTFISYCTGCERGNTVEPRLIFPICRKLWNLEAKEMSYDEKINQEMLHDTEDTHPCQSSLLNVKQRLTNQL